MDHLTINKKKYFDGMVVPITIGENINYVTLHHIEFCDSWYFILKKHDTATIDSFLLQFVTPTMLKCLRQHFSGRFPEMPINLLQDIIDKKVKTISIFKLNTTHKLIGVNNMYCVINDYRRIIKVMSISELINLLNYILNKTSTKYVHNGLVNNMFSYEFKRNKATFMIGCKTFKYQTIKQILSQIVGKLPKQSVTSKKIIKLL